MRNYSNFEEDFERLFLRALAEAFSLEPESKPESKPESESRPKPELTLESLYALMLQLEDRIQRNHAAVMEKLEGKEVNPFSGKPLSSPSNEQMVNYFNPWDEGF